MEMNRRKLLGTVGAVGSFGVSGCLGSVDPRGSQIQLAHYWLSNYTSEPVRLEARVDRGGETVHEDTYELEPKDDDAGTLGVTPVECTWGDEAGEYILYARQQGGDWVSTHLAEANDELLQASDCAMGEANYYGDDIAFWLRDYCPDFTGSRGCPFAQQ